MCINPSGIKDRILHLGIDLQLRVPLSVDDGPRPTAVVAILTDVGQSISAPFIS